MPTLQIKFHHRHVYIGINSIYRVWYYLGFQASTGGLGTYSPLRRAGGGSQSCLYSYYRSATKCAVCKLLVTSLWWNSQRNWKKLGTVKHFDSMPGIFLKLASFLSFFSFSNSFLLCFKKYWPGTDSEFWKKWFLNTDILSNTLLQYLCHSIQHCS